MNGTPLPPAAVGCLSQRGFPYHKEVEIVG